MLRWRNRWLPGELRRECEAVEKQYAVAEPRFRLQSQRKPVTVLVSVTKNKRLVDGVPEQLATVTGQLLRLTL